MKIRFVFSAVIGLLIPAMAAAGPTAQPSCAQVICLGPDHGTAPPSECIPVRAVYFEIRIYTPPPKFNPRATANARHAYLRTCRTAQATDLMIIKMKYGRLFADPISF